MLDLNELEQFVTFAKYGTLSKTAEILNISQPTITRTMQHIEEAEKDLVDVSYLREKLNVCIPKDHELAEKEELTMAQINGFNCLLRDQIGFWTDLCHEKMLALKFRVQTDEFAFEELIRASTLWGFTTNFATDVNHLLKGRKVIPLTDPEADVTYHLICRKEKEELVKNYK